MAGCAVGHHQAAKHDRATEKDNQGGSGSSSAPQQTPAQQ
jgi:hypothetical protein